MSIMGFSTKEFNKFKDIIKKMLFLYQNSEQRLDSPQITIRKKSVKRVDFLIKIIRLFMTFFVTEYLNEHQMLKNNAYKVMLRHVILDVRKYIYLPIIKTQANILGIPMDKNKETRLK